MKRKVEPTNRLVIENMDCKMCAMSLKLTLEDEGISAEVDYESKCVFLLNNENHNKAKTVIEKEGYIVKPF